MQLKQILFLFMMVGSTPALATDTLRTYQCEVIGFATSGGDQDFIQANLEKRFIVQVGNETMRTTVSSKRFNDSHQEFRVIRKDGNNTVGMNLQLTTTNIITFKEFFFEGAYHGTVSQQSHIHGKSWELACQKF